MAMFGALPKIYTEADIPAPEKLDPATVPALRWGVLGAGDIAAQFVPTLLANTKQQVVAVASRTPGKAQKFVAEHGGGDALDSYEELVSRPDIDAVYVATLPHNHLEHALLAIDAGKHVLVEKPSALNSADAEKLYAAARAKGVFAMEAMWTRYLPHISVVRQIVQSGGIGQVRMLQADFGQDNRTVERLWRPGTASIVMDMAIYPLSFAQMLLGNPVKIVASGVLHSPTNEAVAIATLHYESGATAVITTTAYSHVPSAASVSGDLGLITVDGPFWAPSGLQLRHAEFAGTGPSWVDNSGIRGHVGLCYEAEHMAHYIGQGLLESPLQTHADTVAIIRTGEEIRRQIGVQL